MKGTTYQNNSVVTLEEIGEVDDALFCVTDLTACCLPPYTSEMGPVFVGNWYFPNGTRVSSMQWSAVGLPQNKRSDGGISTQEERGRR